MERNSEDELSEITVKFGENLNLDSSISPSLTNNHEIKCDNDDNDNDNDNDNNVVHVIDDDEEEEEDDDDDDDEGEFEFSFANGELHSPVSADEAFYNGQIRPIFAFSGEESPAPVKRMFVVSTKAGEDDDVAADGEYCAWSPAEVSPATEMSRKSNSTGFSRLWRMKDLLVRSNSDGKDTFVFLPSKEAAEKKKKKEKNVVNNNGGEKTRSSLSTTKNVGGEGKVKKGKKKAVTTASIAAYDSLYGNNKEKRKGGGGNRSYLPYRQDLVGFFTNVNGFTRNVHPY
ncbi:hypothetical protein vseg_002161 [Gypsophila vaccaria]